MKIMDTPFAIATAVEKEAGNNYRIDIEIIVPVTLEKFRLDLNELVDQPHQIGGFPASGEWGNDRVVPASEIVAAIDAVYPLVPADERGRLYGFVLTGQLIGVPAPAL